jgi:peptidoglycan L-alanyl-D-glutamate endopeptidase CwlK
VSDATKVHNDLSELAPGFRAAVEAAIEECHRLGYDVVVFEARRTEERQAYLYAQGRTRPGAIVTNAADALHGWHFFGLAVDVISKSREWSVPEEWWRDVGEIFERHGCDWAGRWKRPDTPHMQWGALKPSPSDRARSLYASGGLEAVWREVGAAAGPLEVSVPIYQPSVVPQPPFLATTPPNLSEVHLPPAPRPITAHPLEAEDDMDKDLVVAFLEKELTEERTDKALDFLASAAEKVLPDIPVEVAKRVLDALLPKYLLAAVKHAL